ncbi:MAG: hypothetical protein IGR92_12630 [Leptolyngbyaceae cyanobacterium T60_A2020_046]|nr:hypothetical protein [Leptolyngbyaceae cyanobacterium T60_A2020_046]
MSGYWAGGWNVDDYSTEAGVIPPAIGVWELRSPIAGDRRRLQPGLKVFHRSAIASFE